MGGSPAQVPERYGDGSPAERVPIGVPQVLLVGGQDRNWGRQDARTTPGRPPPAIRSLDSSRTLRLGTSMS
jgi:hypothetical protein